MEEGWRVVSREGPGELRGSQRWLEVAAEPGNLIKGEL